MNRHSSILWPALCLTLLVGVAAPAFAQDAADDSDDVITGTATPCFVEGLMVPVLEGWFTIEVKDPPPGKRGCDFFRPVDEHLGGFIRFKSIDASLEKYQQDPYGQLLEDSQAEYAGMNLELGPVLNKDESVPTLEIFSDGRLYVYEGKIPDNPIVQNVWTVIFRGVGHLYVATVMSPDIEEYWEPNKAAFRRLLGDLRKVVDDHETAN